MNSSFVVWLEGLIVAALGGAVGAAAERLGNGPVDWHAIGVAAGVGALIAVAAWLRQSPIPKIAILLALGLTVTGCASLGGPRHVSTVSLVAVHGTLSVIQDTEMQLVCGRVTAPAPPACVPDGTHRAISAKLATAFELDAQVARTIKAWTPGTPQPAELIGLLAQVSTLVNDVLALLPDGHAKAQLTATIGGK